LSRSSETQERLTLGKQGVKNFVQKTRRARQLRKIHRRTPQKGSPHIKERKSEAFRGGRKMFGSASGKKVVIISQEDFEKDREPKSTGPPRSMRRDKETGMDKFGVRQTFLF